MKSEFKNISLYWKCQILGWICFYFVYAIITGYLTNSAGSFHNYQLFIIRIFLGIVITHQIRASIKRVFCFQKSLSVQVFFFLLITLIGLFVYSICDILMGDFYEYLLQENSKAKFPINFNFKSILASIHGTYSFPLISWLLIYFLYHYIQQERNSATDRIVKEKRLLELEARTLRMQMNPDYIFTSLSVIGYFVKADERINAVVYLTTLSKLIRLLFSNSDKRKNTLYEEIEVCKLYLQLQSMQSANHFFYKIDTDDTIDLKSVELPEFIIQKFVGDVIGEGVRSEQTVTNISLRVRKKNRKELQVIIESKIFGFNDRGKEILFHGQYSIESQKTGLALWREGLSSSKFRNVIEPAQINIVDNNDLFNRVVVLSFGIQE